MNVILTVGSSDEGLDVRTVLCSMDGVTLICEDGSVRHLEHVELDELTVYFNDDDGRD